LPHPSPWPPLEEPETPLLDPLVPELLPEPEPLPLPELDPLPTSVPASWLAATEPPHADTSEEA
jgi:hypothetical protein